MTMQRHVDQDYDKIRQGLLRMGGLVEGALVQVTRALTERDSDLAMEVIRGDREVDTLEKKIDEECQNIMARYQPAAIDLRFLVAVMKIGNDLERVGDSAANIGRAVRELNQKPPVEVRVDLVRLSQMTQLMVRDSLDSLVRRDAELAFSVWRRDDEVDALYRQSFHTLVDFMTEQPSAVNQALQLLLIARNFERVADHATNIAEDVIYFVEGRDIRHSATDYGEGSKEEA